MIPLRDNNPRSSFPWITILIILANCLVFFREAIASPEEIESLMGAYALIPARTTAFFSDPSIPLSQAVLPFFTSLFLHGGWMHIIGNMWFLWIFGDNVEDRVGHLRYVVLYLASGLAGAVTHVLFSAHSTLPTVGASGAIAGVMGAYMITFPRARILTLIPFFFLFVREIPAVIILLYWLLLQFLSGAASLAATDASQGGVAWFAHVGGFAMGIPLMLLLRSPRRGRGSSWA